MASDKKQITAVFANFRFQVRGTKWILSLKQEKNISIQVRGTKWILSLKHGKKYIYSSGMVLWAVPRYSHHSTLGVILLLHAEFMEDIWLCMRLKSVSWIWSGVWLGFSTSFPKIIPIYLTAWTVPRKHWEKRNRLFLHLRWEMIISMWGWLFLMKRSG